MIKMKWADRMRSYEALTRIGEEKTDESDKVKHLSWNIDCVKILKAKAAISK